MRENLVSDERFTIDELREFYLFGIDLSDPDGKPFPERLIAHHLNSSLAHLETVVDIKVSKTLIQENHDFYMSDYANWGYLRLFRKPVMRVTKLVMMYGNNESLIIPLDWVKLDRMAGTINLFPSHGSASGLIINSSGAFVGLFNRWSFAPGLWNVEYEAGMVEIPENVKEYVYKRTAISVLQIWGDLILGAGIASQSISMDGLSQSIGTTQSAMYGGASARIEEYRKDLDKMLPTIKAKYSGVELVVI